MNENQFKRLVANLPFPGRVIIVKYGITPSKKRFAIIINQVLWFAVRLVLEDDPRLLAGILPDKTTHLTLEGALKRQIRLENNMKPE